MENNIYQEVLDYIKNSKTVCLKLDEDMAAITSKAAALIYKAIINNNKLLIFGNGGSSSDSQHFAAEIVGRFQKERRPLPAIALTTDTSIITALANDYGYENIFARQLTALAKEGDVVFAISTSGKSLNIIKALREAKNRRLNIIGLTGSYTEEFKKYTDLVIGVPSEITAYIQQLHIIIIHAICKAIEAQIND